MNFVSDSWSKMMTWGFKIGFELALYFGITNVGYTSILNFFVRSL